MNIHEMSNRTGVSLSTLRKLDRLGVLKVDAESDAAAAIRFHLTRNQQMTAAQFLAVLDDRTLISELGRYSARCQAQLDGLGAVEATLAPKSVTAEIPQAARGDDDAALVIAEWLMSILPADPVPHAWPAVRLLMPLNEFLREQYAPLINLALLNVRRLPEFALCWRSEKIGDRNQIRYFSKTTLDL